MNTQKYLADLHTHTIASGHAYNTINEMVEAARSRGVKLYGITEHAVTMPGTCTNFYFSNLKNARRDYEEIEVLYGVELNIIDYSGKVDMPEELLKQMDLAIASIHSGIGFTPGTVDENTGAVISAMENPYVNIIGHPDDGRVPLDYERIVKAAKETGTLLEINNSSLSPNSFRAGAKENDRTMLKLCMEYRVPVVIGSDAHSDLVVGNHDMAFELMQEIGFDKELVMNFNIEKLKTFLNKYKNFI